MRIYAAISLALFCIAASNTVADDPATDSTSKAIDKALAAYANAYNEKDIDALAEFLADDADFVDHHGQRYSGRDEIAALFRKALVDAPGYTIKLTVTSRQFLSDDLAMDDGLMELTEPSGEVESGRYVTIWRHREGRWLIQNVRDMPSDPQTKATGQNPLDDLQFLVGKWKQEGAGTSMTLDCDWKSPGKLMWQEYVVGEDDSQHTVILLIGWDPAARTVRSWYFDSHGGFGEGTWRQRGNSWRIDEVGVLPDGRLSSSINQWQSVDASTAVWTATHREVDGHAIPDAEVTFVRQK